MLGNGPVANSRIIWQSGLGAPTISCRNFIRKGFEDRLRLCSLLRTSQNIPSFSTSWRLHRQGLLALVEDVNSCSFPFSPFSKIIRWGRNLFSSSFSLASKHFFDEGEWRHKKKDVIYRAGYMAGIDDFWWWKKLRAHSTKIKCQAYIVLNTVIFIERYNYEQLANLEGNNQNSCWIIQMTTK